ncbi:MAG: ABC transporter substrate-binding protein [Albidovulum sp.]|nr:ABC transporter substrate-binding protein [Albidovulum sp.]
MKKTLRLSAPIIAACAAMSSPAGESIVVVSWGGSYEAAQRTAIFEPFAEYSGAMPAIRQHSGSVEEIRTRAKAESWDVIDMQEDHAITACEQGLLLDIDYRQIVSPYRDTRIEDDFVDGAFLDCAVAQNLYATVVAYNDRAFPGIKPSRINDFFDVENFPGKRALPKSPDAILEWALLAIGVPVRQVYDLLSTDRGLRLAFRKLDEIRDSIVWWTDISNAVRMLHDGSAAMASGFNGRFFSASHDAGAPITIIWDGRIIGYEVWAIVASTDQAKLAKEFVEFATSPVQLAKLSEIIPYGPARNSALLRVGKNSVSGTPMNEHLPNAPHHKGRAIIRDSAWYSYTASLRQRRFDAWLETK